MIIRDSPSKNRFFSLQINTKVISFLLIKYHTFEIPAVAVGLIIPQYLFAALALVGEQGYSVCSDIPTIAASTDLLSMSPFVVVVVAAAVAVFVAVAVYVAVTTAATELVFAVLGQLESVSEQLATLKQLVAIAGHYSMVHLTVVGECLLFAHGL